MNWHISRSVLKLAILFIVALTIFIANKVYAESSDKIVQLYSIQMVAGHIWSPVLQAGCRPTLNYAMSDVRIEWARFRGGKWKSLAGVTYAKSTSGAEGFMAGGTLFLRYDFQQYGKLTPYAQIGAGIVYTDIYKDYSQHMVGNNIEFNPQGSVGLRYLLSKHWSMDAEGMFHHVSNAGLKDRNIGVNGAGAFLGITYYY